MAVHRSGRDRHRDRACSPRSGGASTRPSTRCATGRSGLTPPAGRAPGRRIARGGRHAVRDDRPAHASLSGPETRVLDRYIVLALLAAADALADAGIEVGRDVDPYRIGVIVGGAGGHGHPGGAGAGPRPRGAGSAVSPYLLHRHAAEHGGAPGSPSRTASAATARRSAPPAPPAPRRSPTAVRLIRAGEADVVLCGAQRGAAVPDLRRHLRQRPGAGPRLGRPGRGEPAVRPCAATGSCWPRAPALLVLERAEHAAARGAAGVRRRARLGRDHRRPPPDHSPARRRGRGRVHAPGAGQTPGSRPARSATSTRTAPAPSSVTWPSRTAIGDGLRRRRPPVSSTKALTGHMLGASGVVEAAAAASGARPRAAAADAQPRRPGPGLPGWTTSARSPARPGVDYALSNSFGFGGHNVSLLLGRPPSRRE